MKNSYTIGDRTHDLPTCSAVPQPTSRTDLQLQTLRRDNTIVWRLDAWRLLPEI